MVKELNDLIHFVKTSVWRDEALLEFFSKNQSGLPVLYRAIWQNACPSDAAAAKAAGVCLTTYKKQARALREQLRQLTVFFDHEKARVDTGVKNQLEGALETALLQLLYQRGYRHAPLEIAKRLYRRGRDYEFPVFVAEALRVLKAAAGAGHGTEWQFDDYSREYWRFRTAVNAEEQALECWQRTQLPRLRNGSERRVFLESLGSQLDQLEPFVGQLPSQQFHLYYFLARGYFLVATGRYAEALERYELALAHFRSKNYPVQTILAALYAAQVPACMHLKKFSAGESVVQAGLDCVASGSAQFFLFCERYFILKMHAGRPDQALEIYQTATLHKRFAAQTAAQQECWRVLGAYLFILYRLEGREVPEKPFPVFRSVRLANETALCAQDKTGWNAAVQLALLLLQLVENREDELFGRLLALDKYRRRHLVDCGAERSALFARILCLLPKSRFSGPEFLSLAQPLLKQMEQLPPRLSDQHCELEIVPYDLLIARIAGFLQTGWT